MVAFELMLLQTILETLSSLRVNMNATYESEPSGLSTFSPLLTVLLSFMLGVYSLSNSLSALRMLDFPDSFIPTESTTRWVKLNSGFLDRSEVL